MGQVVFTASNSSWVRPIDWNDANNSIEGIGGGGGGSDGVSSDQAGGGGGEYRQAANQAITAVNNITVGAQGAGGTGNNQTAGGASSFKTATPTTTVMLANGGGVSLNTGAGGAGGSGGTGAASNGNGGSGGSNTHATTGGSGGGGAGGPKGARTGGAGGLSGSTGFANGGGGGGSGGGSAGTAGSSSTTGAAGGNNQIGTGGGVGTTGAGGAGTGGGGGAGGGGTGSPSTGGNGSTEDGTTYIISWGSSSNGSGGGGGGAGAQASVANGGIGALYGGGGGGGNGSGGSGGHGGAGIVVVTWTPRTASLAARRPALLLALFGAGAPQTAFTISVGAGNYTLTQEQEVLKKTSLDNIQSGTLTLTVEQEALKAGRKLSIQEVPYTLTGEQVTALKTNLLKAQEGSYSLTGEQETFKKTSLQVIQEGSYALTVETETLKRGSKITSQAGSYSLTGENEVLKKTSILNAQETAYSFTPENETLKAARLLIPQVAPFAVNAGWPSSGLQHRWPLDSADLSGGVDSDVVGTIGITENGTITAAAGPTGSSNAARSFDGTTGYGAFGSSPLPSSGAFTISLWAMTPNINAGSTTATAQTLLNLGTNSGNQMRLVEDNGTVGGPTGGFAWATQVANAQNGETGFAAFANNVWAHVGVTFDGATTYQTFVNGTIVGTPFNGPNNPTANDTLGAKTSASSFFDGSIAQLMIYNRALSAGEIAALYYYPTGINETITLTLSAITSFLMNLSSGTYSLTDEQLTLLRAAKDNLQSGTYTLTVEQQKLLKTSLDNAQAGFYNLTGENETLLRKALDKVQSGSYTLTGENETLKRGAAAFTQAGFYSLTGENVSLKWTHLEQLFSGSYNLTDESLSLTFSGTTNFSINLGTGSYVLTDETVTLLKKSDLGIQVAVYALTDEAQKLLKTNLLKAQMTPYAVDAGWPSAGLQHRWPMDLADNASGVDADVVAGDSATEVGTVTSVAGPTGTPNAARNFDGTTGYATIASSPLPSSGPYTVSVWASVLVRANEAGGEAPPMLNFGTNAGGNQLRFGHDNGDVNVEGGLVWWAEPGDVNKGTTVALFSDNVWAHCAITFDGVSTYQTFFNGAIIATPAGGAKPPIAFDLFASDDTTAPFLNGSLAQVMVYNRVLSASEIAALYNYPEGIGEQVKETVGHLIKAQPVFYAQTDENLVLLRASVAKTQAGLYSLTGPLVLRKTSRLASTVGLYAFTGEALAISTGFPSQFRLTATIRLTGTKSTTTLLGLDDISKLTGGA